MIYFQDNSPLNVDEDQILEFEEDYSDRRSDDPDAPLAVRLSLDIAFMLLLFHVAGGAETKAIQKWSSVSKKATVSRKIGESEPRQAECDEAKLPHQGHS